MSPVAAAIELGDKRLTVKWIPVSAWFKGVYHFRRVIRSGVSAQTVGANAKETRKVPQSNRRFFVGIFESRSATPANTAMMETGIEVNVDRPIANGTTMHQFGRLATKTRSHSISHQFRPGATQSETIAILRSTKQCQAP